MIVDSSALVAIIRGEPERERFAHAILDASRTAISAGNYLETAIVVDRERDPISSGKLNGILNQLDIEIASVTESQVRIARQAYRDFGKHSGHPAKLNFGDCFAYALAMERNEPLLYKGDDFAHAGFPRAHHE